MTLFIKTPRRILEINEAYVMALSFLIFFAIGKILQAVIKKLKKKTPKKINMPKITGGQLGLDFQDDTELAPIILTCIADNERYLIKDQRIIEVIFNLVKAKIKNESLILTPNMLRFLALKLINNDQTLLVKVGNFVFSSTSKARLGTRVFGSSILGLLAVIPAIGHYAVLMAVLHFSLTENCYYRCSDYVEQIPKAGIVRVRDEKLTGHLLIGESDTDRQLDIYVPAKTAPEVTVTNTGELKATKTYRPVRKKAREVRFSDFRKTDPVLSRFKDLEEPPVPQKSCPIDDVHDLFELRID